MITKRFYLVVTAVLALAFTFASCSNNDNTPVDPNVVPNGGPANVTIFAKLPSVPASAPTYAPPTGSDLAEGAEGILKSVTLYAFNASGRFANQAILTVTTPTASGTMQLTTGTHNFYAVANASDAIKAKIVVTKDVTTKDQFEKTLLEIGATVDFAISDGHFMTNITASTLNLIPATSGNNTLTLTIGRALAKVNVEFNDSDAGRQLVSQPTTGVLSKARYTVMRNPKVSHLMPYRFSGVLQSAYWKAGTVGSIKDPVADFFTSVGSVIETPPAGSGTWTISGLLDGLNTTGGTTNKPMYAVENTQERPLQTTQTEALLQGVFTPKELRDASSDLIATPPVTGDSFFRVCLTKADGTTFDKFIDQIFYNTSTLDLSTYVDLKADISIFPGGFPTTGEELLTVEYENGLCYYHIYLQKAGATDSEKYNVARNDYFFVSVTEVRGIGHHNPGVNPDPITQDANIDATITILPWNVIDNPVIIG